jgi:hypothetical protein
MKINLVLLIAVVFISALSVSSQKNQTKWEGTIENKNGVIIVNNIGGPIYEGAIFNLEEEMSIGEEEGPEEYLFSRITDFDVDEEGNIYIIDGASAQIRIFGSDGKYLKSIGKKGQGPGEFQMPIFVQIAPQDKLVVFDYMVGKLIYFSLDGRYQRQKMATWSRYSIQPIKLDSHGNLIGIEVMAPAPIDGKLLNKYDSDLKPIMEIFKEEQDIEHKNKNNKEFDIEKPMLCCAVSLKDNIYWGYPEKYEIKNIDHNGNLIRIIQKKFKNLAISAKDKEKYASRFSDIIKMGGKLVFPDKLPAFKDISIDNHERLYIKTYEQVEGKEDVFYFDVFDGEGKYLAKITPNANLNRHSVWKKGQLYTIESDEKGYEKVVRYKIHWNIREISSTH